MFITAVCFIFLIKLVPGRCITLEKLDINPSQNFQKKVIKKIMLLLLSLPDNL